MILYLLSGQTIGGGNTPSSSMFSASSTDTEMTDSSSAEADTDPNSRSFYEEEEYYDREDGEEEDMIKDCLMGRRFQWNKPRLVSSLEQQDDRLDFGSSNSHCRNQIPMTCSKLSNNQGRSQNLPDMRLSNTSSVASSSTSGSGSGSATTNIEDNGPNQAGIGWGFFDTSSSGVAAAAEPTGYGFLQPNLGMAYCPIIMESKTQERTLMQAAASGGYLRKSQATVTGLNEMVLENQNLYRQGQPSYHITMTPNGVEGNLLTGNRIAPKKSISVPVACPKPVDNTRKEWEDEDAKVRESIYSRATWRMYHRIMTARNERASAMALSSVPIARNTMATQQASETTENVITKDINFTLANGDGLAFDGGSDSPSPSPLSYVEQDVISPVTHHHAIFPLSLDDS